MSYNALLQCFKNERLPATLRCLYARLMLTLYVQRPSVDKIVRTRTCFAYDTLGEVGPVLASVKHPVDLDVQPHEELKKEVLHCLGNKSSFNVPEYEANEAKLTLVLMELVDEFISLGYYSDEKVLQTELILPVIAMLDFSSDIIVLPVDPRHAETEQVFDRHIVCPATWPIHKAKLIGCSVMHKMCDLRLTVRLQRMLAVAKDVIFKDGNQFNKRAGSTLFTTMSFSGSTFDDKMGAVHTKCNTKCKGSKTMSSTRIVMDLALLLQDKCVSDRINDIIGYMQLVIGVDQSRFARILLDTMRSQLQPLAQSALSLLIRERTPKMEMYLQLFDTQLLRPNSSIKDLHLVEHSLDRLRAFIEPFKVTLATTRDPHRLTPQHRNDILTLLTELRDMCSPNPRMNAQEAAGRSFVIKEIMRRSQAHDIVIEMLRSCMTPFGDPNGLFVAAQITVPTSVLVDNNSSGGHDMEPAAMHWLVKECMPLLFEFLEHYSRGLPRNQLLVSRHVLLITSFLRWGISGVPKALAGIFESNLSLCEKMDLRVIDGVVDYLAYGASGFAATKSSFRPNVPANPISGRGESTQNLDSFRGLGSSKGPVNLGSNVILGSSGHMSNAKLGQVGAPIPKATTKPVFDVWCLRFLETAFNIQGNMVRGTQRYILRSLVAHGPSSILVSPEEHTRNKYLASQGAFGKQGALQGADGQCKELALQLFRGREGQRVRDTARKERAGIEDPMHDVLEYNIALLRLLRFLSLDVGPSDHKMLRSLFEPTRIAQDVTGTASLARAKAPALDLFCSLYLSRGLRNKSSNATAHLALWSMLEYLEAQLQIADQRALAASWERSHGGDTLALPPGRLKGEEAQKRANVELELLLSDHWCPMLSGVLQDTSLLEVMSLSNRNTLQSIFMRLMHLLESVQIFECSDMNGMHSPRHESHLVDEDQQVRAKETFVTVRALWKQMSDMEHCPIKVPVSHAMQHDIDKMQMQLDERQERKRHKLPRYTYERPKESVVSLVTARKLQCFAQAFLNVVDPIVDEEAQMSDSDDEEHVHTQPEDLQDGQDGLDEEDNHDGLDDFPPPEVRSELVSLCSIFSIEMAVAHSTLDAASTRRVLSPIESLVEMVACTPRVDMAMWEMETMVLLRVLRGLVVDWQQSVSDSLPPPWILTSIPKLIVELIGMSPTCDRVTMMALELGIVVLQVSPPTPVQLSFYQVLKRSGRKSSDFMGELLVRMRRGQLEVLNTRSFYQSILRSAQSNSVGASCDSVLAKVYEHEDRMRGQVRCLQLQLVQAMRGDVRPTSHVEAVFRFLQLLCEGHNLCLQNYLRTQKNGIRSVDLISATANYVIAATPHICPLMVRVPIRALQFLAESVQHPCRPNQRVLVDTALVASANSLLSLNYTETASAHSASQMVSLKLGYGAPNTQAADMTIEMVEDNLDSAMSGFAHGVNHLKAATITCLLSLLECVDEPYIPGRMLETLGPEALRLNMNNLLLRYNPALVRELCKRGEVSEEEALGAQGYSDTSHTKAEEAERQQARQVAQQFYISYITLSTFDTTGKFQAGMTRLKIWDLEALHNTVGVVEVSRAGVLEKAYFIVPSLCEYLTEASKRRILTSVNRANLQTMLTDFSESFDSLFEEMKHQAKLQENTFLNFFRLTLDWREKVFFYNAILINLLLLLFYNYECNKTFICGDNEDLIHYRIKPGWRELVVVLSCVQCLFAMTRQWWYVIELGIPMINAKIVSNSKRPLAKSLWALVVWLPPELADPIHQHIARQHGTKTSSLALSRCRLHAVKLIYLCTDFKFWTITAQTVVNVLALLIKHEGAKLLLLVHLLEIFAHSVVLQNVMRSITYRGDTLLQTAGLALVMIYFFGVVGFIMFPELFQFAEGLYVVCVMCVVCVVCVVHVC